MPRAISRFGRFAPVLAPLTIWGPLSAEVAAQAPARTMGSVQGLVLDAATDQPVTSATVTLVGSTTSVTTEPSGAFQIEAPTGPVALQVAAPGRSSVVVDLVVHEGRATTIHVPLPTIAVTLSELLVQARGADSGSPRVARTAADLLAQKLPRAVVNSGQVGQRDFGLNLRLASSFGGPQAPTIVVDGVVLSRGAEAFEALDLIPAADVEDIQVLDGPSAAFLYPFAANGVVLVTTKRGSRGR